MGYKDATSFKRTILLNVLNGPGMKPGDRLSAFTASLMPSGGATFSDYTIAQTESVNGKFGTITTTTDVNIGAKTSSPTEWTAGGR